MIESILPPSLQIYSPAAISDTFSTVRTMEASIMSDSPCLKQLARKVGCNQSMVETLLKMHIIALDAFLKQKNGLSRDEIELAAEEIMDTYGGTLTFADIHVVFRNAKLGRYGELYERLSCAKIISWFASYVSERQNMAYQLNLQNDRARYSGNSTDDNTLYRLGYRLNADGRMVLDPKAVEENERKRREAEQHKKEEMLYQHKLRRELFEKSIGKEEDNV